MAKSQSGGFDKILANIWEKIVLGVAIIVTLGLIALSAGGGPKVDVTPEQLTQLASRAEQNYKATPPDVIKENETFAAPRYSEVAKRIREAVSSTGYQIVAPFDPPMFEQRKKRGQPPVFPVSDLRAAAGHGAVAGLGDTSVGPTGTGTAYPTGTPYPTGSAYPGYPGGSPTMPSPEYGMSETDYSGYPGYGGYGGYGGPTGPSHGRRWVVVTGIIEWEKQIRAFRDTFQDAIRVSGQGTAGMTGGVGYPGSTMTGEESYTGYPGAMGSPTGSSEYGYGATGISDVEFPRFVYFSIERAEVTDMSAPVDNLKWEPLNARARWFEEQRIPHDQFMYVSPEYVMPAGQVPLTWPLVQLTAGDTWGKEVAHDPEIPFFEIPRGMGYGYGPYASAEGYPGAGYPTMSGMPGPSAGMPTGLIRTSGTTSGQTSQTTQQTQPPRPEIPDSPIAPGQMIPGMPGASPYGVPPYGMETMPEGSYTSPYGGAGYPGSYPTPTGEEGYDSGYGYGYPGYGTGMVVRKESPTKLFRFVDYKVEPGKTYRYRVKLWLANPNYKLPPQVLEDEAYGREAWLLTDWCTPSNPVRVPADIGVLAGPAKAGRVAFIEPRVTLGVTVFQPTSGLTKFMEFADLPRGTIVDFTAADVKRLNPPKREKKPTTPSPYGYTGEEGMPSPEYGAEGIPGMMGSPGSGPPPGYPGYPGASTAVTKSAEEPEIDYLSRMMIVDLAGGEQLPTKDSAPSVVALMDPEGNLMVRDELEDAPQYNRFTKPVQPAGIYGDYSPEMMYTEEGYSEYYGEMMPGGTRPTDRRRGTTTTRGRTTTPGRNAPRGGQMGSPPMMGP